MKRAPQQHKDRDIHGAGVKIPPPVIFLVWITLAAVMHSLYPLYLADFSSWHYAGIGVIVLGFGIIFAAAREFNRVKTPVEPWKSTKQIVSSGVFAYSRNPIYISFCLMTVGIGIVANSLWIIGSIIPSIFIVYVIAIRKEEAYLEQKFGDEYRQYKKTVRRWL